jgi:histidyl-tRNA synthetase
MTKPVKGTRDFGPMDSMLRQRIFDILISIYKTYGGVPIDTPVLENFNVVKNIYGDEFNKSVYKIEDDIDSDKESLILRYDLTVPCARYLADNGIVSFKRYQIGKVYRRDCVNVSKGRFREFYQADFDIIGNNNCPMVQETEILNMLCESLEQLIAKDTFDVQINSREILFSILGSFDIDPKLYLTVCTTLDKLDKFKEESWKSEVMTELTDKGLLDVTIKEIITFIQLFKTDVRVDNRIKLQQLKDMKSIDANLFDKMKLLFEYLDETNVSKYCTFNPLLSRGLDYYTGLIYEATYNDKSIMDSSIAAGGRYDGLVAALSNKKNISAIGLSIGIERIVTIMEKIGKKPTIDNAIVYVATVGKDMTRERVKLVMELRKAGISTDMSYSNNPKMARQFETVFENQIPFMIVIGENEIKNGTVMLKNIRTEKQTEYTREDAIKLLISL